MTSTSQPRVLVVGGGVAALETVLAVQELAGDRVRVEMLAPDRHFTYRPAAVAEPFSAGVVERFPLAAIGADRNVRIHRDAMARVRVLDRAVETQGGESLHYDTLVLALGARAVEGVRGALTFRGPQDVARVRAVVDGLKDSAIRRVAFAVPAGTTWALPAYELALQTAAFLRGVAPAAEVALVTPEAAPLDVFGAAASDAVAGLLVDAGVEVHTGGAAEEFADGELRAGDLRLPADRVIALPRLAGPRLPGLLCDAHGFVPVDEHMRVLDAGDAFAVGDIAASGVKQGGLATQQADVAAAAIAADAGAPVARESFRPVLRGLLLTGGGVRWLRRDADGSSEISTDPLWWPPSKIAGRHLAPYLAAHLDLGTPLASEWKARFHNGATARG
jgi:sulfide:quinone oxidoreductase